VTLFFQTSSFALPVTEKIELGAAHVTVAQNLYLLHAFGMEGKGSLHPNAMGGNAADGELGVRPLAAGDAYDRAADQLDALPVAFDDPEMYLNIVAHAELGAIGFETDVFLLLLFVN
jgi:hypothetical protein